MKKYLLILVALIGFGMSASAQKIKITNVEYEARYNRIKVTVELTSEGRNECSSVSFKVVPNKDDILNLLNDGAQYGEVSAGGPKNVYFGCGENESDKTKVQQCRKYDFDLIETDCVKK